MDIQTILTLIGIVITFFGIWAGDRFARSRNREERQVKAGKALIESFEGTKKAIIEYNGYFYHLINILREHSENQRIAADEFKRHLSFVKRYRFNKAWKKYQGNNPEILNHIHSKDFQKILLSQIEKILKFTK